MEFSWFDFVVLPILIMMARVVDVSLDTIRVIMVAKGYRNLAPFVGFFQSLIWLITITRIMANLDNWFTYIGYAGGFALGTYVGMILEGKLALGYELIRVITKKGADELINGLRECGYPVTSVDGMGREGEVGVLYIIIKRKVLRDVVGLIQKYNPNAFYTIEDMRFVSNYALLSPGRKTHRLRFRHR
ncbi:MAG: DUF2179 domain-containing protein [Bacteroidota bacterium]|nr:DUF2179 domain-containing protein [Bacteroidota bacterium]